jgi:hypothetical protein
MAFVLADRVQETSVSPGGTGNLTLSGSGVPGFKSFTLGIGTGNTFYYTIYDPVTYAWEVGIGSWTANVLTRTTVLSNSLNTTAAVLFTNGNTLYVWVDYPASSAVTQADVGYAANQIPLNQYLGRLAYQDALSAADDGSQIFVGVTDVGIQANQVPLNQYLGSMAYQDDAGVKILGGTVSATMIPAQPTPTALTASATLTTAQIQTQIIQVTSATAVALTMPTGTVIDGAIAPIIDVNTAIDFYIINIGSASGAVTLSGATGSTLVGSGAVAISTSAFFRLRRTALNTYSLYRLA